MYKDKNKEREAAKERMKRYRERVTPSVTPKDVTPSVTPLPQSIIDDIYRLVKQRISMGLDDDSEERIRRATEYHIWNEARLAERRLSMKKATKCYPIIDPFGGKG